MDKLNFYFKQQVKEDDLDALQANVESAIKNTIMDWLNKGVISGLRCSPHDPADMTVILSAGKAYDKAGRRIRVGSSQQLDCTEDSDGDPTAPSAGRERYLGVFLIYKALESDPRTDGNGDPLFYHQDDSWEVIKVAGAEAAVGSAEHPSVPSQSHIECGYIRLEFEQTEILEEHIEHPSSDVLTLPGLGGMVAGLADGHLDINTVYRHDPAVLGITLNTLMLDGRLYTSADQVSLQCWPWVVIDTPGDEDQDDTWYFVYAYRDKQGKIAWEASKTAPTVLRIWKTAEKKKRLICSFYNDSGGNIRNFRKIGDRVIPLVASADMTGSGASGTWAEVSLPVPVNAESVEVIFRPHDAFTEFEDYAEVTTMWHSEPWTPWLMNNSSTQVRIPYTTFRYRVGNVSMAGITLDWTVVSYQEK